MTSYASATEGQYDSIKSWLLAKTRAALRGKFGSAIASAIGQLADEAASRADQVAALRMPKYCPDDALASNGAERNLDRGLGETADSYRDYLVGSFEHWASAGTRNSLQTQIAHFLQVDPAKVEVTGIWPFQVGVGVTRIVIPPPGYGYTPEPGWKVHDKDTAQWSRFWVEVHSPPPWGFGEREWDDGGTWDGDAVWDSLATPDQVRQTMHAVNKWKPAHARLAGIWFTAEGFDWGDGTLWGDDAHVWGPTGTTMPWPQLDI